MGNLRKRLAKRLRELRGETSQLQFIHKLGLSQSSLNRIEMGDQNVTLDTLEELCKRLKCDVGDLFAEENRDVSEAVVDSKETLRKKREKSKGKDGAE